MPSRPPRVLFILKLRSEYGCPPVYSAGGISSGLFVSARMVAEMLAATGKIDAQVVQVVDNNDIDREVSRYRPTHAIIEGLWVVPEKFEVLKRLHPRVKWIVRIHSEPPFLAMEGIAIDWIFGYVARGIDVAFNSDRAQRDFMAAVNHIAPEAPVPLLPNYYPVTKPWWQPHPSEIFRVGCFGAIRPLKNQLIQAMAAIAFAQRVGKKLRFYLTVRDCEQGGDQCLKNIRALFRHTGEELIEREWMPHEDFLGILDLIDVGLACSLSESFCIVAADMVNAGVPVVVSPEIRWASWLSKASPTEMPSILRAIGRMVNEPTRELITWYNRRGLAEYGERSRQIWLAFLGV